MHPKVYLPEKCYKKLKTNWKNWFVVIYHDKRQVECSTFFQQKGLLRFHRVYSLHLS
jgi:hypothetical protein